jgi:hypothetical protein
MNILHLTLKKRWFEMIASGEKREEYREIKSYWTTRLTNKKYDAVQFTNGYSKNAPRVTFELNDILSGLGVVEWGAPVSTPVFILRLGRIISRNAEAQYAGANHVFPFRDMEYVRASAPI